MNFSWIRAVVRRQVVASLGSMLVLSGTRIIFFEFLVLNELVPVRVLERWAKKKAILTPFL